MVCGTNANGALASAEKIFEANTARPWLSSCSNYVVSVDLIFYNCELVSCLALMI